MPDFAEQPSLFDLGTTRSALGANRLRERFARGGADAMPDDELLELLLIGAAPVLDTARLARALLERFGDLGGVLSAPPDMLATVPGLGRAAFDLTLTNAVIRRALRAKAMNRPVVSSWQALLDYCQATLGRERTERFRVLFLDAKNVLIADEEQAKGTVDHVPVYPREVVKRALELGAKALILVHNHPSGDPTPSETDRTLTKRISEACDLLDIVLHDHIVIGRGREVSFRAEGYL